MTLDFDAVAFRQKVHERLGFSREDLKSLREEACLSQAEIAKALGVSREAIYQWEVGKRNPQGEYRVALCELIDILREELGRA